MASENRTRDVELRAQLFDHRNTDGLSKVVEYAMLQQQRVSRLMTRCAVDELAALQGEYWAYQRVVDAITKQVNTGNNTD